jgi:hypothetical protein
MNDTPCKPQSWLIRYPAAEEQLSHNITTAHFAKNQKEYDEEILMYVWLMPWSSKKLNRI